MALADIIIPRREIAAFNTTFTVRPLCVDDVMRALFDAQDEVQSAARLYQAMVKDSKDEEAVSTFLAAVVRDLPALAARVVAYACDEHDKWDTVLKLPLPVQTDAFYAVFELTFAEPDSLKKFVEKLKSMTGLLNLKK